MQHVRLVAVAYAIAALALLGGGCGLLDEPAGAAATSVRAAATPVPAGVIATPTRVPFPTRQPVSTRTPTPEPADDAETEQSVADARAALERVLRSAALPGIEDLLVDTVALAAPTGGDQLPLAAAARWLRQRASGRVRVTDFQRHQHQALIFATTQGWAVVAPLTTGQLGLTLRRYDAGGAQDPDRGDWLIDTFEAE